MYNANKPDMFLNTNRVKNTIVNQDCLSDKHTIQDDRRFADFYL